MQKNTGLDIHKKFIYAVVLDDHGNVLHECKIKNEPHELDKFLARLDFDDRIALESCSCWEYVYDYLTDAGFTNVFLACPGKVRLIAESRKKTDRHDAKVLADLVRTNMLPTSYAPPSMVREQRQLTRYRASLARLQNRVKNKIHAILTRNGIGAPVENVFQEEGIAFLQRVDLPEVDRYQMDRLLGLFEHQKALMRHAEERIEEYVEHVPQVKLLMTIPGVSYYSGLAIHGEIGEISRFDSARKLASFAGLNPSVSQSGDRCRTGHIAKQGDKHLRWMLGQCANIAIMHDPTLARFYQRIKKRRGHNIAITATSRKMLHYIHVMLTHHIPYQALQIHKAKAS